MFQFSIRTLFIVTTIAAVFFGLGMLIGPGWMLGMTLGVVIVLSFAASISASIYLRGNLRAFAIGFAIGTGPSWLFYIFSGFRGVFREFEIFFTAIALALIVPTLNGFLTIYFRQLGLKTTADEQQKQKSPPAPPST